MAARYIPDVPDVSIRDQSVHAAPKAYTITGAQDLTIKAVTASFDGTSAAGSFVPALQVVDSGGNVVGTYTLGSTLAAGASADVSWFPIGGSSGSGSATPGTWFYATPVAPATAPAGAVAGAGFQNGWGNAILSDGSYSPLLYRQEPATGAYRVTGAIGGGVFGQAAVQIPFTPARDELKVAAGSNNSSALLVSLNRQGLLTPIGPIGAGLPLLFSQTVVSPQATIDTGVNGIPGGHADLLLLIYGRTSNAGVGDNAALRFNGDSGANYDNSVVRNQAGVANVTQSYGATSASLGNVTGATETAGIAGALRVIIPAYDATTFFKAGDSSGGTPGSSSGRVNTSEQSFTWHNTAAITQVTLLSLTGSNWLAGSRMAIYGMQ